MAKAHALLITEVAQELQDTSKVLWVNGELVIQLEDVLREVSEYDPYIVREVYELESRTGKATATTSAKLEDTDETQFVSVVDINKVIFNKTKRTWAIVTAVDSTSVLSISKDIMTSGDEYRMYNRDCWNNKQIYLGDVEDYIGDDHGVTGPDRDTSPVVEYRLGRLAREFRNAKVSGHILSVDTNFEPVDSKQANLVQREVEVGVWFRKRHQVSQLTDLVGTVSGAEVAGATTMDFADLSGSEVVAEDTEFTVANARGLYRVITAVTLSTGSTTTNGVSFWPPALDAFASGAVLTITGSTLTRKLERLVVQLCAGRAAISKGALLLQQSNDAITANDKATARVGVSQAALASAMATLNKVNKGGPGVPAQYAAQAAAQLATGTGYSAIAQMYLLIAERSRDYSRWGQDMVDKALAQLQRGLAPNQFRNYPKD